ncbi:MAG: hypothetical protein H8D78_03260 [Chloroflexi bacterium]|nr:hypothetical protein [Chloroflexota bacterium]
MEEKSSDLVISPATQADCRIIARLMLERRIDEPRFRRLARRRIQRTLYERWAAPRFLFRNADTFQATIGGELAGFLILLYEHPAVVIVDMAALEPCKGQSLENHLLAHAARVADQRQYPYLRAALSAGDAYIAERFLEAGFQPLEFRRWEFTGTVAAQEVPEGIHMQPLVGRAVVEKRKHYLQMELDEAQPVGRELIEAHYLPKRPPVSQAFELLHEGEPFGYLSARRERGTYVLNLSTLPRWWGSDLEVALVTAFPAVAARAKTADVRLLLDTTPHADALAGSLVALGLQRGLSDPDVWLKTLGGEELQAEQGRG